MTVMRAAGSKAAKAKSRAAVRAAGDHFRTEPRLLARPMHGAPRLSVESEIVLHTPEHDPPFQVERCCTRCGSSDPARWPATRTRSIAGGAVRVPDGHRCFWCRCYELSSGRPEPVAPAPTSSRGGAA